MNVEISQAFDMLMRGSSFFACAALVWIMLRRLPSLVNDSVKRHTGYPSDQQMLASLSKSIREQKELLEALSDDSVVNESDARDSLVVIAKNTRALEVLQESLNKYTVKDVETTNALQEDLNKFAASKGEHDQAHLELTADMIKVLAKSESLAELSALVTGFKCEVLETIGKLKECPVKNDVAVQLVREMIKLARISELMPVAQYKESAQRIVSGVLDDLNIKVDHEHIDVSNAEVPTDESLRADETGQSLGVAEWPSAVDSDSDDESYFLPADSEPFDMIFNVDDLVTWIGNVFDHGTHAELMSIVEHLEGNAYKAHDQLAQLAEKASDKAKLSEYRDNFNRIADLLPSTPRIYQIGDSCYLALSSPLARELHLEQTGKFEQAIRIDDLENRSYQNANGRFPLTLEGKPRYLGIVS